MLSRRIAFTRLLLGGFVGALLGRRDAFGQTAQYTYDASGRVTSVRYSDGFTIDYAYDAAGNRSQVVRSSSPPFTPTTPSTFTATITITGSAPVNLRTLANAAGYNGAQDANVTFVLNAGTTITGAANGGVGIDAGVWPVADYLIALTLQISGAVYGGGGGGGAGGGGGPGEVGYAGGDAIICRTTTTLTINAGGQVKSGGGGGTGGAGAAGEQIRGGGGGGGGAPNGPGGPPGDHDAGNPQPGAPGTVSGGGAGGVGYTNGSAGGNFAQPGNPAGGASGYAVRVNGNTVTVANSGVIVGVIG